MSSFVKDLILRHTEFNKNVLPRQRGMFESEVIPGTNSNGLDEPLKATNPTPGIPRQEKLNNLSGKELETQRSGRIYPHTSEAIHPLKGREQIFHQEPKRKYPSGINENDDSKRNNNHVADNTEGDANTPLNIHHPVKSAVDKNTQHSKNLFDNPLPSFAVVGKGYQGSLNDQSLLPGLQTPQSPHLYNSIPRVEPVPTIKVTIGRIDVRAIAQPPVAPVSNRSAPKPKMSLDEYLKKRNSGKE